MMPREPLQRYWWQWWRWGWPFNLAPVDRALTPITEAWCGLTTGHRYGLVAYIEDRDRWYINCPNCLRTVAVEDVGRFAPRVKPWGAL